MGILLFILLYLSNDSAADSLDGSSAMLINSNTGRAMRKTLQTKLAKKYKHKQQKKESSREKDFIFKSLRVSKVLVG